jgi:hypothetical protein
MTMPWKTRRGGVFVHPGYILTPQKKHDLNTPKYTTSLPSSRKKTIRHWSHEIRREDRTYRNKFARKLRVESSEVSVHLRKYAMDGVVYQKRISIFNGYLTTESRFSYDNVNSTTVLIPLQCHAFPLKCRIKGYLDL